MRHKVIHQFMLGSIIPVSPVVTKEEVPREVFLPGGRWTYVDGRVYDGSRRVTVDAPIDALPYFVKA